MRLAVGVLLFAVLCSSDSSAQSVAQEAYIKASNTEAFDGFGGVLAVSGETVVVGVPNEDSDAVGINGDPFNNNEISSGAAYVFVRTISGWAQQAYLKASNAEGTIPATTGDWFGGSVAIDGDTIIVGASRERSDAVGVNGDETDNSAFDAGAAYVFRRQGTTWSQEAYLKASNTEEFDLFGRSVAISGDTVVVGATGESSPSTGVNGDQSDGFDPPFAAGAAYVFVRTGSTWNQQAYLKASNTDQGDRFGAAVAIDGDTLVVGTQSERSNATGVNGDESDNSLINAGAAYVFQRTGSIWIQEAYLKASNTDAGDWFGISVSISGDTVAIGAQFEESDSQGVNGNETGNTLDEAGAVYVFRRVATSWLQEAYIKASNTGMSDHFGFTVSIDGDCLAIGAPRESSDSVGVGGDQSNDLASGSGAVYLFERLGSNWSQTSFMKASNAESGDFFGSSVSLSGSLLFAGAAGEKSSAVGVNGDEDDNMFFAAGAAYAFDLDFSLVLPPVGIDNCSGDGGNQMGCTNCPCMNSAPMGTVGGCLNSAGTSARLSAGGDTSVSLPSGSVTDLRFSLTGAPPTAFGVLNSGDNVAPANMANPCFGLNSGIQSMLFDGLRCAIGSTRRHGGRSADGNGDVGVTNNPWGGEGAPPAGIAQAGGGFASGQTRHFQVTHRDDPLLGCMRGLNTTQAVEITFTP